MKHASTLFLKFVIYALSLAALGACAFAIPAVVRAENIGDYRPILIGMYISAIPFFIILYKGLRLLKLIDTNTAFSQDSVDALKHIKYFSFLISIVYAIDLPFIYRIADRKDAPGLMVLGLILAFGPLVVTVFAAVLEKLLQNAIDIKSENDLTV